MILSVFTRHSSNCKFKRDRLCHRCSCPKWIGGQVNKEYFRQSAATRIWDEAEQLRVKLEDALAKGLPPFGPEQETAAALTPKLLEAPPALPAAAALEPSAPDDTSVPGRLASSSATPPPNSLPGEILPPFRQKARVTVQKAVEVYMADARSRGLQTDTVKKLERLFEKQFSAMDQDRRSCVP
jgi:integrase/recombinase XerD